MISRKSTFFLGIFIFVIPFLGFPMFWKTSFTVLSGLTLLLLSVKLTIPKRNFKPRTRKEKVTPVYVESIPVSPIDDTIETAEVVKPRGRRKSEVKSDIRL